MLLQPFLHLHSPFSYLIPDVRSWSSGKTRWIHGKRGCYVSEVDLALLVKQQVQVVKCLLTWIWVNSRLEVSARKLIKVRSGRSAMSHVWSKKHAFASFPRSNSRLRISITLSAWKLTPIIEATIFAKTIESSIHWLSITWLKYSTRAERRFQWIWSVKKDTYAMRDCRKNQYETYATFNLVLSL